MLKAADVWNIISMTPEKIWGTINPSLTYIKKHVYGCCPFPVTDVAG